MPKKEENLVETKQNVLYLKIRSYTVGFVIKHYQLLVMGLVLLILLIGGVSLIWPKYHEISDMKNISLAGKENLLKVKTDLLKSLQSSEIDYQKIENESINKVYESLPNNIDIPGILVQMEKLTLKNDVVLLAIDINEETLPTTEAAQQSPSKIIKKAKISLNLQGTSYESFKGLLNDLEYNLRIVDIDSITFSPDFKSISINLVTYYQEG